MTLCRQWKHAPASLNRRQQTTETASHSIQICNEILARCGSRSFAPVRRGQPASTERRTASASACSSRFAAAPRSERQRASRGLIQPGQSCFVDAGSTTALFAEELAKIGGITVITNSIDVATTLRSLDAHAEVLLLGGRLMAVVPATAGELTLSEIGRVRICEIARVDILVTDSGIEPASQFAQAGLDRVIVAD